MTTPTQHHRGRSDEKRAAILGAAERLFIDTGYRSTSMDTIAREAEVSKRTVYDHFGDKESVFAAVAAQVTVQLTRTLEQAVHDELPDGCELGPGLLAFARRVTTRTFPSSEYAALRGILSAGAPAQTLDQDSMAEAHQILERRIRAFVDQGTVTAVDSQRAAEHFIALTFLLALDELARPGAADPDRIDEILVDGVDAFVRAYATR